MHHRCVGDVHGAFFRVAMFLHCRIRRNLTKKVSVIGNYLYLCIMKSSEIWQ